MNTQQAYINGFVKRASEYGYSQEQALGILKEADFSGVMDSLKQGYGKLKNRLTGDWTGYPEPIGPMQPEPKTVPYGVGSRGRYLGENVNLQPYQGSMSAGNTPSGSSQAINLGTNLTGDQPAESPAAALMRGVANNSSLRAGLQGAKNNWQATKPHSIINDIIEARKGNYEPTGNPVMNLIPFPVRVPLRGALAAGAGGYAAGEDILNKAVNRNPRIAAGLQGYADKAQSALESYGEPEWTTGATGAIGGGARIGANVLKGLASIPAGAKGAYNAVKNYNQTNPQ